MSPEELMVTADQYVKDMEDKGVALTMYGFILYAGLLSFDDLYRYRDSDKEEAKDAYQYVRSRIAQKYEENLTQGKQPTGSIFWLSNRDSENWQARVRTDVTSNGETVNSAPTINIIAPNEGD